MYHCYAAAVPSLYRRCIVTPSYLCCILYLAVVPFSELLTLITSTQSTVTLLDISDDYLSVHSNAL